ncbi:MAG TPA: hypothetical protein VEI97_08990 [bacterium]|nr:hypothetical protein [bacterium]
MSSVEMAEELFEFLEIEADDKTFAEVERMLDEFLRQNQELGAEDWR